ncbi:hypothetical protein LJC56_08500 [Christensenellaceae bacterium OttesenSCG-928-K19]|nr:hypothetical protein [Christensenellaceae bacterium OttesenSCG-928-K19]
MAEDRFITEGYKIIQSVEIDGMEIAIGENRDAEQPFMMARRSVNEVFGAEKHLIPVYGSDYVNIFREFIQCQSAHLDNLSLDRVYRGSAVADAPLEAGDCVPGGMDTDLEGKVVALKAGILRPEYRACSHQLMLATGGFGCSPNARGRTVFCVNLYSGDDERWNRSDILGVVAENTLPGWAHEKLARLREPREKESVIAKIRKAKNTPAPPREEGAQPAKSHEPEI